VLAAELDPVTKTRVTLTTSTQAQFTTYTVTVNGLLEPHGERHPDRRGLAGRVWHRRRSGGFGNAPEAAEYTMVYSLDIGKSPNYSSSLVYDRDNHELIPAFDRVAYYLELQTSGGDLQFAWVSMDAFTHEAACIGVPTAMSGAIIQQPVTNMIVRSNSSA
jgi:hypothetical protein